MLSTVRLIHNEPRSPVMRSPIQLNPPKFTFAGNSIPQVSQPNLHPTEEPVTGSPHYLNGVHL